MWYNRTHPKIIALLTFFAVTLSQLGIGLYLPSFPYLVQEFHTSDQLIQLTLTTYLAGFGISQLIYGPISDSVGRRPVMVASMFLVFLGALGCTMSNLISSLLLFRFIQGLGTGGCVVLSYAILKDLFDGTAYAQAVSMLSLFSGLANVCAPFIGGLIEQTLGWRSEFGFLLMYSGGLSVAVIGLLPETKKHDSLSGLRLRRLVQNYESILHCPKTVRLLLVIGLLFGAVLLINAMLPFVLIERLAMPPAMYGVLTLFNGVGFMLGTLICVRWVKQKGVSALIQLGLKGLMASATLMMLLGLSGLLNWQVVVIPIVLMMVCVGIAFPSLSAAVLQPYGSKIGFASALMGAGLGLMALLTTVAAGFLRADSQMPLAWGLVVISLIAWCLAANQHQK